MKCICMPKISAFAASLQASDVALQLPAMPAGAADLAVMANTAAAMNAAGELAASGQLEAMLNAGLTPPSMEGLLAMEAMAQVAGGIGIGLTGPGAAMQLSLAAGALNLAAPAFGELGTSLGAAMEPVSGLTLPLSINAAIQAALGIDMAAPGAATALEASFAAALEASASLAGSVSMEAAIQLGMAARALNAAIALGFQPGAPGAFAAALEASASLDVPPLLLSAGQMAELSGGLSGFGLVNQALGGASLEASSQAIEASMEALSANFDAALEATASMAAEMSAAAEANAQLGAALAAAAGGSLGAGGGSLEAAAELGGLELGGLPSMGDLSLAATLCQSFESASGMPLLSSVPCPNIFCVAGR